MKNLRLFTLLPCAVLGTLATLVFAPAAQACYSLYNAQNELVYDRVEAPVNMAQPLHDTVKNRVPGGYLVFSTSDANCSGLNTLDRSRDKTFGLFNTDAAPSTKAQPAAPKKSATQASAKTQTKTKAEAAAKPTPAPTATPAPNSSPAPLAKASAAHAQQIPAAPLKK